MQPYRQVTDEEWARVEPLIPELKYNPTRDPRGRPMTSRRDCLNATIWVMYSGASWQTLPRRYPSYQTCHRSFKAWYDAGVLHRIAHTLFGAAAESFLEVVSARIRSGTRARQALNAAAGAAATGRPSSNREAGSSVRGGRRPALTAAEKPGLSGKRTKSTRTPATQASADDKASPRKVPARKAAVREPAVRELAVRKPAAAQRSAGAERAGAGSAGGGRVRTTLPRSTPTRAGVEETALVRKITPRDTSDERLSVRKARRASAAVRSQEMAGSA